MITSTGATEPTATPASLISPDSSTTWLINRCINTTEIPVTFTRPTTTSVTEIHSTAQKTVKTIFTRLRIKPTDLRKHAYMETQDLCIALFNKYKMFEDGCLKIAERLTESKHITAFEMRASQILTAFNFYQRESHDDRTLHDKKEIDIALFYSMEKILSSPVDIECFKQRLAVEYPLSIDELNSLTDRVINDIDSRFLTNYLRVELPDHTDNTGRAKGHHVCNSPLDVTLSEVVEIISDVNTQHRKVVIVFDFDDTLARGHGPVIVGGTNPEAVNLSKSDDIQGSYLDKIERVIKQLNTLDNLSVFTCIISSRPLITDCMIDIVSFLIKNKIGHFFGLDQCVDLEGMKNEIRSEVNNLKNDSACLRYKNIFLSNEKPKITIINGIITQLGSEKGASHEQFLSVLLDDSEINADEAMAFMFANKKSEERSFQHIAIKSFRVGIRSLHYRE
ncbi:hypothetical protein [Pantoea phytobeneficialis]|uniref:Uncharacterized protein n=1 Tax=Pantoea phytobeneficialis TaxID=2052056 RepID=A0AAP9H581_9GAMM|nr:hypothetical protein [Pantoea phytobeneficialis]MDO6405564.1 hypothetical protein [Pantoea phytobeneficialis]QGR06788.1 hypothetical protein CTZ24_10335 [Pantoea phytobeneficialis]